MTRCKACYPGDPLLQCERDEHKEGTKHSAAPRRNSPMRYGQKEDVIWYTTWYPAECDPEYLAALARRAREPRIDFKFPRMRAVG